MEAHRYRRPRTATLWLLATLIILCDQLSKAWFVFRLGNLHHYKTFIEFLPNYLGEFKTTLDPEYSIIYSKYYNMLLAHDIKVWDPWIRFYLTTNQGAAWSMFTGNSLALSGVSVAIAVLLWFVWKRNFVYHHGMTLAIGAIIGGALGNFIDRFRLQEVVDFVAVKIPYIGRIFPKLGNPYDFPIFNVADASAVCGTLALAGYLLYLDLTAGKRKKQRQEQQARGFKAFDAPDPDAIARAHKVNTAQVPTWDASTNSQVEEQAEVSGKRADQVLADDLAARKSELTDDYQPTASSIEVTKAEEQGEDGDVVT